MTQRAFYRDDWHFVFRYYFEFQTSATKREPRHRINAVFNKGWKRRQVSNIRPGADLLIFDSRRGGSAASGGDSAAVAFNRYANAKRLTTWGTTGVDCSEEWWCCYGIVIHQPTNQYSTTAKFYGCSPLNASRPRDNFLIPRSDATSEVKWKNYARSRTLRVLLTGDQMLGLRVVNDENFRDVHSAS